MGLFSNLLETYKLCSTVTGISLNKNGNADERKTFLPILHSTFKSDITVVLDGNGKLLEIIRDNKTQKIIIPVTEKSASRTHNIAPHPLCDKLSYFDSKLNRGKFEAYISQLAQWKGQNVKLNAVYNYLTNNNLVEDMLAASMFSEKEMEETVPENANLDTDSMKNVKPDIINKLGVRFCVQIPDDLCPNLWEDTNIRKLWIEKQIASEKIDSGFDYMSGESIKQKAKTHPKNINYFTSQAKLLSCNDKEGMTFRGRFVTQDDAIQIDTEKSQNVHQTLRWLINNYGIHTDSQVIVIWAVDSESEEKILPFYNTYEISDTLFANKEDTELDSDKLMHADATVYGDYAKTVAKILRGYGTAKQLKNKNRKIVMAIFDAATTGRMGITFYQELPENEYLENIAKWHEESAWYLTAVKKVIEKNAKGKDEEITKIIKYVGCPSFNDILLTVYGKPRSGNDKTFSILKKNIQKQLIECMFGNFAFPKNLVLMAANRVSRPMLFIDDNNSFKETLWRRCLEISCSLIKKYIKNTKGGEISMELETLCTDRDYLYGRLLAVADKMEEIALWKSGKGGERTTNAVKLMSSYAIKPFYTRGVLWQQLTPYIIQLGSIYKSLYLPIITEIDEKLEKYTDDNRPLSPIYLLGYSAQYRALTKNNKLEENDNANTTEKN